MTVEFVPSSPTKTPKNHTAQHVTGFSSPAQDYHEPRLSIDELVNIRAPNVFLMRSTDDSLNGIGIFKGDLIVVDRSLKPSRDQVVVVETECGFVARILSFKSGRPFLKTADDGSGRHLRDVETLSISGVVTFSLRYCALFD